MIVSIAETIKHQEPERRLFLKKNDGEAENRKIRVIIPRERLLIIFQSILQSAEITYQGLLV